MKIEKNKDINIIIIVDILNIYNEKYNIIFIFIYFN